MKLPVVYYQASPRVFKPDNTLLLLLLNSTSQVGTQNKDFGAVSQTDLTRGFLSVCAQAS